MIPFPGRNDNRYLWKKEKTPVSRIAYPGKKYYNRAMSAEKIRLNKYLSEAGVCSRREADQLILEGRVTVDGRRAVTGERVESGQRILVDGKRVTREERKVLLLFNKPRGIICTAKNQKDNIVDYVNYPIRVYPVGRLDVDSQGLILLTNQGDLVNKIMRAGNYHEKEYLVTVDRPVTEDFLRGMGQGVPILDTVTRPCTVTKTGENSFRIILTQGLNRQIRRMCEYFGYHVVRLNRIRIMNLKLGDLPLGRYREVTPWEMRELRRLLSDSSDMPAAKTGGTYGGSSRKNQRTGTKVK